LRTGTIWTVASRTSRRNRSTIEPRTARSQRDLADWLENYRRFWDESLDRLDAYLKKLQQGDPDGRPN